MRCIKPEGGVLTSYKTIVERVRDGPSRVVRSCGPRGFWEAPGQLAYVLEEAG